MSRAFGDDAIIRTDGPTVLRSGGVERPQGKNCRSGCKTKDHTSYAECCRAAGAGKTYLASPSRGLDGSTQKRWDRELDAYRAARRQGVQPDGTTMAKVEHAMKLSEVVGARYGVDFNQATPMED